MSVCAHMFQTALLGTLLLSRGGYVSGCPRRPSLDQIHALPDQSPTELGPTPTVGQHFRTCWNCRQSAALNRVNIRNIQPSACSARCMMPNRGHNLTCVTACRIKHGITVLHRAHREYEARSAGSGVISEKRGERHFRETRLDRAINHSLKW